MTVGGFSLLYYETRDGSQLSSFHDHLVCEHFNYSIGEEELGINQSVSRLPNIDPPSESSSDFKEARHVKKQCNE